MVKANRRCFLQQLLGFSGAAALVAAVRRKEAGRERETAPQRAGYRETDHIRRYYRRARL